MSHPWSSLMLWNIACKKQPKVKKAFTAASMVQNINLPLFAPPPLNHPRPFSPLFLSLPHNDLLNICSPHTTTIHKRRLNLKLLVNFHMAAHFFAKKYIFQKKCPAWFMKIHICSKLLRWTEFTLSFSTLAQWKLSHKQPFRRVLGKMCSENMQQTYRRTPMPKCDFNRAAKQLFWNHTSA